jgi:predicted nucleic acid-binding protein
VITADTNVFVYASDDDEPLKQSVASEIALALVRRRSPLALQLIGELQNALRRKLKLDPWEAAQRAGDVLAAFDLFPPSLEAAKLALAQVASGRLSYWDALMLAAAREAGCTVMLSEDMQDGGRLFGLEIVNPFAAGGVSVRAAELLSLA